MVGESELFGAKLNREKLIWFNVLQAKLDEAGHEFQVMNASVIGYNGQQAAEAVSLLPIRQGDILLIRPNQNDVSIAYVNGEDWEPEMPWPLAFIHKLQRHTPWYTKLLDRSCLGMHLRHRLSKDSGRVNAFAGKPGFQWNRLVESENESLRRMTDFARSRGADVAMFDFSPSYTPEISPEDEAGLSAIQVNWRGLVEGWSKYQFGVVEEAVKGVAEPLGLPVLRIAPHIWSHPMRYRLFLDVVHFNAEGHKVFAEEMFNELNSGNLLRGDGA